MIKSIKTHKIYIFSTNSTSKESDVNVIQGDVIDEENERIEGSAECPDPTLLPVTNSKENETPQQQQPAIYQNLNLSGVQITSFTPHSVIDTGLRRLNTTPKKTMFGTPSEPYGTPKSILSETNPSTPLSSMHLIDFTTPRLNKSGRSPNIKSSAKTLPKGSPILPNSRFSTPIGSTPTNKPKTLLKSVLKGSTTKTNNRQLKKKLSMSFENASDTTTYQASTSQKKANLKINDDSVQVEGINSIMHASERASTCHQEIPDLENTNDLEGISMLGESESPNNDVEPTTSSVDEPNADVVEWVESVMAAKEGSEVDILPNEKTQILSNRFSNITNDSFHNITEKSSYADTTSMLGVSSISKINVSFDGVVEASNDVVHIKEEPQKTESSLRSTRKQIGRALVSLNTSATSEMLDQNEESIIQAVELNKTFELEANESVEYANLTTSRKDYIEPEEDHKPSFSGSDDVIAKQIELEIEMSNLSELPTQKNKNSQFLTPQRSTRQMATVRNTVGSKLDLPKRNVDRQYMLQENLNIKLQRALVLEVFQNCIFHILNIFFQHLHFLGTVKCFK